MIVIKKLTFPNDKVITIEMTEKQISGRNISLNIDYEDVLSADSLTRYYWRNDSMKKIMFLIAALAVMVSTANAQNRSGRLSLGTGLLYERGMDLT